MQPESGDYVIVSDTWNGIRVTIVDATSKDRARLPRGYFATDQGAYRRIEQDMEAQSFYPNVWIQWDQTDPQLYEV